MGKRCQHTAYMHRMAPGYKHKGYVYECVHCGAAIRRGQTEGRSFLTFERANHIRKTVAPHLYHEPLPDEFYDKDHPSYRRGVDKPYE